MTNLTNNISQDNERKLHFYEICLCKFSIWGWKPPFSFIVYFYSCVLSNTIQAMKFNLYAYWDNKGISHNIFSGLVYFRKSYFYNLQPLYYCLVSNWPQYLAKILLCYKFCSFISILKFIVLYISWFFVCCIALYDIYIVFM